MTGKNHKPPRIGSLILKMFIEYEKAALLAADFEEVYNELYEREGRLAAVKWYWLQLLCSLPSIIKRSAGWSVNMWTNYWKVALRNIKKFKGFSCINIAGLAMGMACCILILMWISDEMSFDRFHENYDRLTRIVCDATDTRDDKLFAVTPAPFGKALKRDFPEIEKISMYGYAGKTAVRHGEDSFYESYYIFADPDFFDMFTFPLVKGDPAAVFSDPYSVVITRKTAEKYFKDDDPIGKVLTIDNQFDVTVTGVVENVPGNSSIQFDFISPFEILLKQYYPPGMEESWDRYSFSTYVLPGENTSIQELNQKIRDYIKNHDSSSSITIFLQELKDVHLHAGHIADSIDKKGNIKYVYVFSALAFLILITACINFMNLMTARAGSRAKEVGMRKVVGACKSDIIRQFFGETLLLSFFGLLIAIVLVWAALPGFNALSGKNLAMSLSGNAHILAGIALIALITGITSGSYPALFISSFQPVQILKGSMPAASKGYRLRSILVVSQFSLSIMLITGATVLTKQIDYIRNRNLGYNSEHIVSIPMSQDINKRYDLMRTEMLRIPEVAHVTASGSPISRKETSMAGLEWEGKADDSDVEFWIDFVGYDYIETLDIEVVEGRSFSREFSSHSTAAYLLNEEAVRQMGLDSPVGKRFVIFDDPGVIIGVMKDFNFRPLHSPVGPLILAFEPSRLNNMHIKMQPGDIPGTMSAIEKTWKEINPGYPFTYRFVDEDFNRTYRTEQSISTIFRWSAFLGIFISCLGLIGLASYIAERRTKEMGIRKVLGATEAGIMMLNIREFVKWAFFANIIAWPAAWYGINRWLNNYAYKTDVGPEVYVLSGLFALTAAVTAVGYQAVRAARANPVDSLRPE